MKENSRLRQAKELLVEYIRMKGKRMTPERMAILEAAYEFDTPFTIDLMKEYLEPIYHVTRQTVYNNLELFFQVGIVMKRPIGSGAVEYETCFLTQTHHHLVCQSCGQIFEFKDATIEPFLAQKRYKQFKMTNCTVFIYGLCKKCQGKIQRERRKQQAKTDNRKQKQNTNRQRQALSANPT